MFVKSRFVWKWRCSYVKAVRGCFGTLRARCVCVHACVSVRVCAHACVCGVCVVGVSICPRSYFIFSSVSPARALSAALSIFWSTEGFVSGAADCGLRNWMRDAQCQHHFHQKQPVWGDLAKSVWLKPAQTFIYLLERSRGRWRPAFWPDSLTFISCFLCSLYQYK